ncbi:DUF4179 domain-containing protein [Antrihabitans sp. YC2-6]|jgi:hypothetical protein|uniref:DUF4179 domain-containing protein n=1 Tax=Antrihabitans sp. YC2-6 TaxID=2799498 RepID=UPI0018F2CB20|nr:DUF4179 domain-containing protein [Antrihabitans sp. YC2-6]MBJ8343358.1 DUF4179 domain-containing protein [Antrihabitans sp. YC2-6]
MIKNYGTLLAKAAIAGALVVAPMTMVAAPASAESIPGINNADRYCDRDWRGECYNEYDRGGNPLFDFFQRPPGILDFFEGNNNNNYNNGPLGAGPLGGLNTGSFGS